MSDNPFSGPFAGNGGIGGNPFENKAHARQACPKCDSENFTAYTNQYGVMRKCLEPSCKNEWSGGTMASGRDNFGALFPQPMPGQEVDDDLPIVQFTGSPFRDPSNNYGDDY